MASRASESDLLKCVRSIIPPLTPSLHKGQAGRIGVVGGCQDYTGAPYFAAISAMKVGADLGHVFCAEKAGPVIKSYSPELIVHPVLDIDGGAQVQKWLPRLHCLVIGPGLGNDPLLHANVKGIIEQSRDHDIPLILDAEGIRCFTSNLSSLTFGHRSLILTPNAVEYRELSSIMNAGLPETDEPDMSLSEELCGATVVRKGPTDVITNRTHNSMSLSDECEVSVIPKGPTDVINNRTHKMRGGVGGRATYLLVASSIGLMTHSNMTVPPEISCTHEGSARRCGGQGDLLAGSMAVFLHWAHDSLKHGNDNELLHTYGPEMIAAYGACTLTRECNRLAYQTLGRSMLTTDMITHIHTAFENLYGS